MQFYITKKVASSFLNDMLFKWFPPEWEKETRKKQIHCVFVSEPAGASRLKWPAKCCNYFEKDAMFTPSHASEWE